jgi:plastocyanin
MRSLVKRAAAIVLAAGVVAGVLAGATAGGDHSTARAAANVTITARDFFWSPDAVTIQVGDTVTWTNAQGFHNVLLGDSRLNQPGFPTDPSCGSTTSAVPTPRAPIRSRARRAP